MLVNKLDARVFGTTVVTVLFVVFLLPLKFRHTPSALFHHSPQNGPATVKSGNPLQAVMNETLGFQKIFVINLPSRTDHRDAIALSAALTGIQVEFIDGVTEVDEKTLPPQGRDAGLTQGKLGNWRAHLDAVRAVIEQNLTSALILEDDADWDVRIKDQMMNFARASNHLTSTGPIDHNIDITKDTTINPTTSSPYGDTNNWDLLWVGHCGATLPPAKDNNGVSPTRAIMHDDATVPQRQHVNMQFGDKELVNNYPDHTRIVSRAWRNVCTLAYGLSQQGARRLLYELSMNKMTGPKDLMYQAQCDGSDGRATGKCYSVQPQLFQHHRPRGLKSAWSDLTPHGGEDDVNETPFTRNIRWSTRMNIPRLIEGRTDYEDQFRDGEAPNKAIGW